MRDKAVVAPGPVDHPSPDGLLRQVRVVDKPRGDVVVDGNGATQACDWSDHVRAVLRIETHAPDLAEFRVGVEQEGRLKGGCGKRATNGPSLAPTIACMTVITQRQYLHFSNGDEYRKIRQRDILRGLN